MSASGGNHTKDTDYVRMLNELPKVVFLCFRILDFHAFFSNHEDRNEGLMIEEWQ